MKKVLFATTALVMTAGIAAAEVTLSGDGRLGIVYDGNDDLVTTNDFSFNSRARVTFTLTGESDAGLSFGGSFRADQATGSKDGFQGSVFVSGTYGTLSMGDVDDAAEAAVGDLYGVGYTGLGDFNETWYINSGFDTDTLFNTDLFDGSYAMPAALYEYSFGATTFYAGFGNPAGTIDLLSLRDWDGDGVNDVLFLDNQYSVGVKYATDTFNVGLGYETFDSTTYSGVDSETIVGDGSLDQWVVGGEYIFGSGKVKAIYGDSSDADLKQYGVSAEYAWGATLVDGYVRRVDIAGYEVNGWGLGATYDLGGGAAFEAGIFDTDIDGFDPIMDAGITFTF